MAVFNLGLFSLVSLVGREINFLFVQNVYTAFCEWVSNTAMWTDNGHTERSAIGSGAWDRFIVDQTKRGRISCCDIAAVLCFMMSIQHCLQ